MTVIDADSHFIEPLDWLAQTDAGLAAELAERAPLGLGEQLLGEILGSLPEEDRPPLDEFMPPARVAMFRALEGVDDGDQLDEVLEEYGLEVIFKPPGGAGGADRVAFCDERGIDIQYCLPTMGIPTVANARSADKELGLRVAAAYNDWAGQACAGHTDRLLPVAQIPLDDVAWAEAELRRTHEFGARGWVMPLNPTCGRALGDPAYDALWAASLELGMIPLLHQGLGWTEINGDWLRVNGDPNGQLALSTTGAMLHVLAQLALANMIYQGVFKRFPELVVICQEFGLGWIDDWIERIGPMSTLGSPNMSSFFPWEHDGSPIDIMKRNLRFTPLRGQRVDEVIDKFGPDLVVFASDYPHPEGIQVDWEFYDNQLADYSDEIKARFYGGSMAELMA